ncbi:putative oxidoreductase YtbE [Pirellula sp. SH-Sr6A]|uniref:aldo/keto reductase n=1 Tax=Pirellula sp. SH-Sr6A TaxID=1632865 RepID=UPI00078DF425|nr:aldo/keto reductase [Pirellula sp. SH-Sr6A]AMV34466.1 putative oxidoreductase YtbE [Pirellula sp. SH-Sr6A]
MSRTPPSVGYGFWKVEKDRAAALTVQAIEMGYRHLDCASDYGNEAEVGQGIEKALSQRLCVRDALWVTSKLWNTNHRAEHVLPALKRSLSDLRVDYLDLYLIHFPISLKYVPESTRYPAGWFWDPEAQPPRMEYDPVPIRETWQAMEELVDQGLVKQIGVSNFSVALIRDLLAQCSIRPSVLQVEAHPYLVQAKLLRYCQQESIAMTAFSPLGAPSYIPLGMATKGDSVLEHPVVVGIAKSHGKSPAQVVLRWGVQRGTSVIPKSSNPDRLRENLDVDGFVLSQEEMGRIDALDRHQRFNDPGVFCEQAFNTFFPIYE